MTDNPLKHQHVDQTEGRSTDADRQRMIDNMASLIVRRHRLDQTSSVDAEGNRTATELSEVDEFNASNPHS